MARTRVRVVKGPLAGPFLKLNEYVDYSNQPYYSIKLANGMMVTHKSDFVEEQEEYIDIDA